ncbi:MAG: hypothetical protein ACTSP5_08115 [Candidatus Heimdallarchaeota archaeon]
MTRKGIFRQKKRKVNKEEEPISKRSYKEIEEEIIAIVKSYLTEENDFLDVFYEKTIDLIGLNEEYHRSGTNAWEILSEIFGSSFIENYFVSGKVKNWVGVFEGYFEYKRKKKKWEKYKDIEVFGELFGDTDEDLDSAVFGLAESIREGKVSLEEQEKLIPLLQKFPYSFNGFPELFKQVVACYDAIGSKKVLPYLRKIIEDIDRYDSRWFGALLKISDEDELNYLCTRFHKDPSPSVQLTIYNEINKIETQKA